MTKYGLKLSDAIHVATIENYGLQAVVMRIGISIE